MQEIVVIDGEITLENVLDGEVELEAITDLDPDVVMSAGGGITPSGTIEITENGVYDVTEYASADVDVQGGITPTGTKQISIASNGTVTEDVTDYASAEITTNVPASAVDTGTKNINSNGTHDVIGYASASVAVPNSYSASDEGKVVSNGALVAQTSDTVTANDTYDTTLINSLTVNVSGGGGISADDIAMCAISGDIVLNTATEIKDYAFYGCTGITSLYSDTVTTVGANACYNIDADIILPNVTAYGQSAFAYSDGSVILPNIKTIVNTCRYNGDTGKIVCFSRAEGSLPTDCFRTDYHTIVDIGYIYAIGTRGIYQGNNKTVLILRYTGGVVDASATSAIGAVPASCKVYVPSALFSLYQQSTQWSSKDLQVLEGSIYEDEDWALS